MAAPHMAALDPHIAQVLVEKPLVSYRAAIRSCPSSASSIEAGAQITTILRQ
jgi:hypothetical protein